MCHCADGMKPLEPSLKDSELNLCQVELVSTACYGVRVYTNTSWLANHVDTRNTHAVSVIMQIDQVGIESPET